MDSQLEGLRKLEEADVVLEGAGVVVLVHHDLEGQKVVEVASLKSEFTSFHDLEGQS